MTLHLQGIPGTTTLPLTALTYLLIAFAHFLWNFQVPSIMHTHTHSHTHSLTPTHIHIRIHIGKGVHCEWSQLTMQASLVHISVMVPFVQLCWACGECKWSLLWAGFGQPLGSSPGNAYFLQLHSARSHTLNMCRHTRKHTHVRGLYRGVPVHFGTSLSTGISDRKWHWCSCSCVCFAAWPTPALLADFVEALNRGGGREGEK